MLLFEVYSKLIQSYTNMYLSFLRFSSHGAYDRLLELL